MPIPFLNSITLNKNEIQEFKVYNLTPDPTLTSAGDYGYMWLNTSDSPKTLKWWDGTSIRSIVDSGNTSTLTVGTANDLSGGVAGSLPYQQGVGDTTFLGIGTADQVLTVNSGATAPQWTAQSSLSVGSATNKTGGNLGDILVQSGSGTTSFLNAGTAGQVITSNGASPQYVNQSTLSVGSATTATTATNVAGGANGSILVQSGAGTTGQLAIGASGYILTSNGTTPGWSASIPSTSVSGLAASATTDTTNASNISSGTLGLARLSLASGQFYVGDGSNNPAATAKSSIPLSGFGAAGADVAMGGFKITGLGTPTASTDAATMGYVDSVAQGLDVKASCLVATTADITLASPGAVTIDGIYSATDFTAGTTRILVKDQSAAAENGIYIWQGPAAAMTRSADADTWDELVGAFTFIERGTANADSGWVCSVNAGGTLGSTAVTFVKFSQAGSYTAGNGIVQSGTSFNFAQSSAYTAGQIPFAKDADEMTFSANLHWDNSNNRLGIGTATPIGTFDIRPDAAFVNACSLAVDTDGSNNPRIRLYRPDGASSTTAYPIHIKNELGSLNILTGSAAVVGSETVTSRLTIASDGVCTWSNVGGVAGTAMTLNGTGLGVGTDPTGFGRLVVRGTAAGAGYLGVDSDATRVDIQSYNKPLAINRSGNNVLFCEGGGNVGIGTATPAVKFHVSGSDSILALLNGATKGVRVSFNSGESKIEGVDNTGTGSYQPLSLGGSEIRFDLSNSRKATLDSSGNLGLGVTPSAWAGGGNINLTNAAGIVSTGTSVNIGANYYYGNSSFRYVGNGRASLMGQDGGAFTWYNAANNTSGAGVSFSLNTLMVLDSSGNLGLGVTPKSWNVFTVFQNKEFSFLGYNYGQGHVTLNAYYQEPSGVPTWKFIDANGYATRYTQEGGYHKWFTSTTTSGGADSSLTWTSALMTLDSSGKLGIGSTPSTNLSIGSGSGSGGYGGGVYLNRGGSSYNFYEAGDGTNTVIFGLDHTLSYAKIGSINSYPISLITDNSVRLTVKATGQVNFNGLASDPAGAAGDVYYNSGSNVFKVYDTGWKTLPRKYVVQLSDGSVTVVGNAYTLTHNFASKDVTISIRRTTDDAVVLADVTMPTTNTATVTFASAITAANYYVTVIG